MKKRLLLFPFQQVYLAAKPERKMKFTWARGSIEICPIESQLK
jgi:hypothetical protein